MGRYQSRVSHIENETLSVENYDFSEWPTEFPKSVIGIDRDGVINEWKNVIKKYEDVEFIDGSLEAIRQLRLKGHKVVLFSDQPNIVKGLLSDKDVDNVMQYMMNVFGQHGIFSIDGFYYTRTDAPQDVYSKPNVGMLKRSQRENGVDYSTGYYVGDTIEDIKMAQKIGATPILVRTGKGKETEKKHFNSFNSKYENVEIYDNLLEFAKNL